MTYILYKTTNIVNERFYVGVHDGSKPSYLGSGVALKSAVRKYGKAAFVRETLCQFDTAEEAYEAEELTVTLDLIKSGRCYNLNVGGKGGFETWNQSLTPEMRSDHAKRAVAASAEKRKTNPELWANQGANISAFWRNNPDKTAERAAKLKATLSARPESSQRGAAKRAAYWAENPEKYAAMVEARTAAVRNPEVQARRGPKIAEGRRGGRWINNGERASYIKKGEPLPEGWRYGKKI